MKDLFPDAPDTEKPHGSGDFPPATYLLAAVGVPLGKTRILDFLRQTQARVAGNRAYTQDLLTIELNEAIRAGQIEMVNTGYVCKAGLQPKVLRGLIASGQLAQWRPLLFKLLNVPNKPGTWSYPRNEAEAIAALRIALACGMTGQALAPVLDYLQRYDVTTLCFKAFCHPFDEALWEAIAAAERDFFAERSLMWMLLSPNDSAASLVAWAWRRIQQKDVPGGLFYRTCEHLLWQGRQEEAMQRLAGDEGGAATALRAAAAAMRCDHVNARTLYAKALELLREGERKRVGLLPFSNAWLYTAVHIIAGEPKALEEARRFARAEARKAGYQGQWQWSGFEQVANERLGDSEAVTHTVSFSRLAGLPGLVTSETAAWLKRRTNAAGLASVRDCGEGFARAGYHWAARECAAAALVLEGKKPDGELAGTLAAAFANEQQWRRALAAISALADTKRLDTGDTRIVWIISMKRDAVTGVTPWEQKRGPRGWNKGKRAPYAQLAKAEDPHDVRACRALDHYSGTSYDVNVDRVLPALVGHPLVFFDDDMTVPVELVAGEPEITVTRSRGGKGSGGRGAMRVSLFPDVRALTAQPNPFGYEYLASSRNRERALLVRETPTRARVVRVTAAHRRIAELIGESLEVPEEGAESLSKAIESAARFFHVHSDVASAVPEVPADATLRAELAPAGEGLRLRLAVQPFGDSGPRFAPGAGGARVIAELAGERRAAVRDMTAERRAAQNVIDALPALLDENADFEWVIGEPDDCLALVETLQTLQAANAGTALRIEWPSGAKFKVTRAYGAADLTLKTSSGTDWFVASGGIKLDEGLVIDMARLIEFSRQARGRFVPLGEGGFLALTDDLKRRIDDLASLGELSDEGLRVHPLAAGALEEIAEGTNWRADKAWQARLAKVREAQTLEAEPPSTLSAELRDYQAEGFRWLARLAHWGAGACLADDMGLGKTVQALALLLRRAPDGAALVVAPTSVCSQWVQEARRFAPTLNLHLFSEGERAKLVNDAGAFDVVVCTYTLMQQDVELFTSREWHTVILDEAQAVKNFATKRAQAVFSLKAGFRLATTGTPVENRMDELWTLFRFLNPGLLGPRERFNERYAGPIERARDARARARLRRLTRPFILRRTKSEVLAELPPRTEIVIEVEAGEQERAFYEALRRRALAAIESEAQPLDKRRFEVLAQLMRLRRSCCDPRLVTPESGLAGAKLEAFSGIVEELIANKHKALVFSQFVDYLTLLRRELERMGVAYQYLDGSTPAAERARAVAQFQQGEGDIFLISLRAGGFGLNLTAADYVIIADPWWNPAVEDQAASRAHRMGQERPVTVYRLVMKDSIEQRIMAMHQDKRALAEGLFTGEAFGGAVSVEELVALMREETE